MERATHSREARSLMEYGIVPKLMPKTTSHTALYAVLHAADTRHPYIASQATNPLTSAKARPVKHTTTYKHHPGIIYFLTGVAIATFRS